MRSLTKFLALLTLLLPLSVLAHPIPDIPVRTYFKSDGTAVIRVEVDPRCFVEDPEQEPYLTKRVYDLSTKEENEALVKQTREYIKKHLKFYFQPLPIEPDFKFTFTSHDNKTPKESEDPIMVTGEWSTKVPKGIEGYQIECLKSGKIDVQFLNFIDGVQHQTINVLFPGEKSFLLDLSNLTAPAPGQPQEGAVSLDPSTGTGTTFLTYLRWGFVHVVPYGLDHILFVIGLFFLSREWRPLIYQVSVFTVAHTITLGMATMGVVNVSAQIVEPIIALSIAYIAVENICRAKYTHWRLLVVFVFGLIHGLGFASVLGDKGLPPSLLVTGLIGFNIGVEFGQLSVIAVAFAVTVWLRDPVEYRRYVVVPGSAMIAAMGLYWTVERVLPSSEPETSEASQSELAATNASGDL
ncbi:MAG: HupE/UreJ family protein [Limisphaerales bacterium]